MATKKEYARIKEELTIAHEMCHTLFDCMNVLSDEQFAHIARCTARLTGADVETVSRENAIEQIKKHIDAFYHFAPHEFIISALRVITKDCGISLPLSEPATQEIESVTENSAMEFALLQMRGIIFLFKNDGKITPVVPDEAAACLREIISADSDLAKAGDGEEFHKYAATLTQLYGICPITVFMELWNRDYPASSFANKSECKEDLRKCYSLTVHFNLIGTSLVSPHLESANARERLKEKRQNESVYMPSTEEIKAHLTLYDYDEETEAFQALKKLLLAETKDYDYAEHIAYFVVVILKIGTDITKIADYLENKYGISFSKSASSKFFKILMALGMQCHLFAVTFSDGETGHCSVMGNLGECFSLVLYVGNEGLASYYDIFSGADEDDDEETDLDILLSQNCIQCSLENKSDLFPNELKEFKAYSNKTGKTIKGRKKYIHFSRYSPNCAPWYVKSKKDLSYIEQALEAATEVAGKLKEKSKSELGFLGDDDETENQQEIPILSKSKNEFTWKMIPLPENVLVPYFEPILSENAVQKMVDFKRNGCIECKIFRMPMPMQKKKTEAPRFPVFMMCVDADDGTIVSKPDFIADKNEDLKLFESFANIFMSQRMLPESILAFDDRTVNFLKNFCFQTGTPLHVEPTRFADDAFENMMQFMGRMW